ncbi:MAG TPA: pseudouridine synthase [Paludibacteraceae bacterium]|nr:pseudouridine synthase [Paludibacteraceae bacterium]
MRNENERRPRVRISRPGSARRDGVNNNAERANSGEPFSREHSRPRSRFNSEERDGNRRSGSGQYTEHRSFGRRSNAYESGRSERPHFSREGQRSSYNRSSSDGEQSYFADKRSHERRSDGYRPKFETNRSDNHRFGDKKQGFRKPFEKRDDNYDPNAKYSQRKQIEYKKQYIDYTQPMRLNRFLANAGLCSRREADEFIQAGVVSVNGHPVTELGTKIIPATDKVLFHDQLVRSEKRVYILLNKPKDCVTTADDPQARLTVLDLVKNACTERVYPVGRLDRHTTGVLLITNDGDLTSKMTHPKYNQKKIYHVALDRELTAEDMEKLRTGIELEDGEIHVDEIDYIDESNHKEVGVEIHSGRNRIVRRMFDHLGYKVVRLDRVYFAGLTKKNLPRGKWRYLSEMEVNMLKMSN